MTMFLSGKLTSHELEVLCLVAEGLSNKQIGAWLGVTEGTVKSRISHAMTKLNAYDRTHAVVLAYRWGMVELKTTPARIAVEGE